MINNNEESLPKNVRAMIQEHTAGGYILFKIDADGFVYPVVEVDDEKSYLALLRKMEIFVDAVKNVDEQSMLQAMYSGPIMELLESGDFNIDDEEDDDGEEYESTGD